MSASGSALVMTIDDRRKCFEERKELGTNCTRSHFVNLGVDIDTGVLLTPDSSPSTLSNSSSSLHRSRECLVQQPPPPEVSRCSVLAMSTIVPSPPPTTEHHQQPGGYIMQQQPTTGYPQVGSPPLQMGSPYSACSSPESQVYSPEQFDHQMPPHSSSPPYPSPSPYQTTAQSPGQYSGRNGSVPSPTYSTMDTMEGVPALVPFTSPVTTSCGVSMSTVFNAVTGEPVYTMPHVHPHMVEGFGVPQEHHLPPFPHVFDPHLADRNSSPESLCSSDSAPLTIKQMPNEFGIGGIEFYHPPTPPNMVEGAPNMLYHPDMCGGHGVPPPGDICGQITPLPSHLCPIPTLGNHGRRRQKQQRKVPVIEVDDSDIKDIPTSAQLWEFTLRVLKKPKYKYMVSWEKREEGLFRFNNAQAFAALWGKHRNRPQMSYDKVARALRYYYKRNILEQVGGRLTYRFTKRLSKLYLSDV